MKAIGKLTNAAKFSLSEVGLTVYTKNAFSRGEFTTNSVYTDNSVDFCLADIATFLKVLTTINKVHDGDFSDLEFKIKLPFITFKSKKIQTKITTVDEAVVSNSISSKITTPMTSVLDFTTRSETIKEVKAHSFIMPDIDMARIYLEPKETMENNVIYATIGNNINDLNNSITLKFGLVNAGSAARKIVLNFDRLEIFNIIESDKINISLMDKNALVYNAHIQGESDMESYLDFRICCSILAEQ